VTDPQRSFIAVLLDRSGSMETIKSDTEGGFDAFMAEQRKGGGGIRVTLAQFDTEYEVVYANRPLDQVPPLALQPRGATALYDAVGKLITDVGAELAAVPDDERPGSVVVVVLTDGHENSSKEWTHEAVHAALRRQERDYSWAFIFLGANMDAVQTGERLGFAPARSLTYALSGDGVSAAWAASSRVAREMAAPGAPRAHSGAAAGFSDEERTAARGG
jgi:hypothetical protein